MEDSRSKNLIEQIKHSIENCFAAPDSFLHFKNINGKFGKISLENLIMHRFLIEDKSSDMKYIFDTTDGLIAAGWAID